MDVIVAQWGNSVWDIAMIKNSRQWNYSAQGAVVAHAHGVTLGQSVQDSFAIVHINEGANVKVQNAQGVLY